GEFLRRCERDGVSVAHLPVGFLHELADELVRTGRTIPGCLRLLITGGESPSGARIATVLRASSGGLTIQNGYGPTEAFVEAANYDVTSEEAARDPVPIGRPIVNTTVHVLDAGLREVPLEAVGEMSIGRIGLGRSYACR